MKYVTHAAGFGILILAVLSCGLAGKLMDKGLHMTRTASLWSDVPQMEGLESSETDMPIALKLVVRTFVNTLLNNADKDSKPVTTDWVVYGYKGSETDIKNFYTPEKMKSAGNWDPPEKAGAACMDGKEKGLYGNVCLYQKTENGKNKGLVIVALPTEEPKAPVFVYFIRLETDADVPKK